MWSYTCSVVVILSLYVSHYASYIDTLKTHPTFSFTFIGVPLYSSDCRYFNVKIYKRTIWPKLKIWERTVYLCDTTYSKTYPKSSRIARQWTPGPVCIVQLRSQAWGTDSCRNWSSARPEHRGRLSVDAWSGSVWRQHLDATASVKRKHLTWEGSMLCGGSDITVYEMIPHAARNIYNNYLVVSVK